MKKRILSILLAAVLIAGVLGGCGAQDAPAGASSAAPNGTDSSTTNQSTTIGGNSADDSIEQTNTAAPSDLDTMVAALTTEPTENVVQFDQLVLLAATGAEGLYKVQDAATGKHGIYEYATRSFVVEPCYDYMGYYYCGLAVVLKDGFWGYVNAYGEKVIGLYYEEAGDFINDIAVVRTNGKYGAIDSAGNTVVNPEYDSVSVDAENSFVCGYTKAETGFYNGSTIYYCDIYDQTGALLVSNCFGYEVVGNKIFALTRETVSAKSLEDQDWYVVLDLAGNPLFDEGIYATLPINGISVIHGTVSRTNGSGYRSNHWFSYMDENGQLLTDEIYSSATPFSGVGYAAVEYTPSIQGSDFYLIDKTGSTLRELPYSAGYYVFANEYMVYAYNPFGKTTHTLYCISTGETIVLTAEPRMIDGTNCIVVQDNSSGLFGLYDGANMVLEYVYNELSYDGIHIIGMRGAETVTYTPAM